MTTETRYYRTKESFNKACKALKLKPTSVDFSGGETVGATGYLTGQTVKVILVLDANAWNEAPNYQKF